MDIMDIRQNKVHRSFCYIAKMIGKPFIRMHENLNLVSGPSLLNPNFSTLFCVQLALKSWERGPGHDSVMFINVSINNYSHCFHVHSSLESLRSLIMCDINQTNSITDKNLVANIQLPISSSCPSFKNARDDYGPTKRCVCTTTNGQLDGPILRGKGGGGESWGGGGGREKTREGGR